MRPAKVAITEVGTIQAGSSQPDVSQLSPTEVGISQVSGLQVSFVQNGITEVGTIQAGGMQVGITQVSTSEVDTTPIIPIQSNPTKISLPSSVPSQQLFSIHTLTPESITTLTVVDAYGLEDTKTVTVYVGSTAPTENDDQDLPDWTGDFNDIFSQFDNMN